MALLNYFTTSYRGPARPDPTPLPASVDLGNARGLEIFAMRMKWGLKKTELCTEIGAGRQRLQWFRHLLFKWLPLFYERAGDLEGVRVTVTSPRTQSDPNPGSALRGVGFAE